MKRSTYSLFLSASIALALSACSSAPKETPWNSYDVRHPVPIYAPVPDGYARQYDQYIDNDSYYAAPDCSIMDLPSCVSD